jgi:hypothetical protein
MRKIIGTLIALTTVALAQPVFAQPAAPEISSVQIVPPAPGTDPTIAAFSGKWQGQWKNGPMVNLAVKQFTGPQQAIVVYALGDYAAWDIKNPLKADLVGNFEGDKLIVKLSIGTVTYTLDGSNKLSAVFLNLKGGGRQTGTLTRTQ